MKVRWFNVTLFAGLALWMAYDRRWFAIGFALMAGGQVCMGLFWAGDKRQWNLVEAFGLLTFVGIAEIVASGVGPPNSERFWLVLSASLIVLAPVALIARRLGRSRARA
jgi:hypothetical protein